MKSKSKVWCTAKIDLFHRCRLLHGNEFRMLFSQSILDSNYQTDMISFFALTLVFKVSLRVKFRIGLFYYLTILAKLKHKTCQFGSCKQVLTDWKAYEPRFREKFSIYEKRPNGKQGVTFLEQKKCYQREISF